MVRNLEHVGSNVGTGCEQRLLGIDLGVAGQQDVLAVDRRPQDERRVVRVGPGVMERDSRGQHLEVDAAGVELLTYCRRAHSQPAPLQRGLHEVDAGRWFGQRAGQDGGDAPAGEDAGDAADMVEVIVREDQQRDLSDAEVVQAAVDGHGVRPGIDFDRRVRRGGEQESVALADVARDERPVRRRPAGCDRPNRDQDDDRGNCGGRQATPRPGPGRRYQYPRDEQQQRQPAAEPAGPGQGRAVQGAEEVRHPDQPATRPARKPGEQLGRRQPQRRHDRRGEAEDGRDRHHGLGQHISRNRDQADPPGYRRDDRGGHDGGRGGHRHQLGDPGRDPPPQRLGPARREHEQRSRGQHRHGEAGIRRELRIPKQECQHGCREGRQGVARPPAGKSCHRDHRHERGPQHTRRRSGHGDENDEHERPGQATQPGPDAEPAQHQQHRTDQDRAVGAADRNQVGQAGEAKVLCQHWVEFAGVAVDQTGQQATSVGRQPGRSLAQRRADRARSPLPPRRRADQLRAGAGEERDRQRTPVRRRRERAVQPYPLARQDAGPRLRRSEHEHVAAGSDAVSPYRDRHGGGFDGDAG